jgi:hypothetical protein
MAAGEIVVSLLAKTGSFDTDIARSTKAAERHMKEMKETAAQWGVAVGAAFTAAAAAGTVMAKQIIDGMDALNDVADATGASIENISALEDVAVRTGSSMEAVSAALVKFNGALKEADGKNGASMALKAIGLEADALRSLDPAEALRLTAVALSKFADDGNKARLVQELFGKSVAEVGPLLKDLAEKGELVATVTTEQAKQAEAFNQQLAGMKKNVTDLGRSIAGDLLPRLNEWATVIREGGLMTWLGLGGNQTGNPGKALDEISGKLGNLRKMRDDLDPSKGMAQKWDERLGAMTGGLIGGDLAVVNSQIKRLEAEQKVLQALQSSRALEGLGDTSDALSRRGAARPSVGVLPTKGTKGPKGPDPDADFKSYLNNLQQQIQKVGEMTVSEKLLDDIKRKSLSVTPAQQKQLADLAGQIDRSKASNELYADSFEAISAAARKAKETEDEYKRTLAGLLDGGPAAKLEKQRKDMQMLADEFQKGNINADQFNDAATGALNLTAEKATQAKTMTEELGLTFASAFEQAVIGGGSVKDVFKGLLQDIAQVILRMQVIEPLMKQLKDSMTDDGGGGGAGGWFKTIASAVLGSFGGGGGVTPPNPDFGGFRAAGGPVAAGVPYMVGERGPELFTPRTAGAIVPNHAIGSGKDNITIVNQTTGRIDRVQEQRYGPGERALIIQEAVEAAWAQPNDPNSRASRTLARNFNVRRNR